MFICTSHNWSSLSNSCPLCPTHITVTADNSTASIRLTNEDKRQGFVMAIEALRTPEAEEVLMKRDYGSFKHASLAEAIEFLEDKLKKTEF